VGKVYVLKAARGHTTKNKWHIGNVEYIHFQYLESRVTNFASIKMLANKTNAARGHTTKNKRQNGNVQSIHFLNIEREVTNFACI
jgi:hypothetical protein